MIVAREIARRYAHQGIISISLNPGRYSTLLIATQHNADASEFVGNIDTELHRFVPRIVWKIMVRPRLYVVT